MSSLSLLAKRAVFRLSPELAWRLAAWWSSDAAFELRLARALADPNRIGIDIGGSWGLFAAALGRRVGQLHIVEPNPEKVEFLRATFGTRHVIHAMALSDMAGEVALHIPDASSALATIEARNPANTARGRNVMVRRDRLDALNLAPVGFIKMDVEGHEAAALAGAEELLRRDHPTLLVEMEERHRPGGVRVTIGWLEERGYRAFMLDAGQLRDAAEFEPEFDQPAFGPKDPRPTHYINDFLFIPRVDEGAQMARLAALGISPLVAASSRLR
ncbi:FkbM family methyltransferase [Sediminicoccus sp. KRV36]|uniref:FkbM family methyltransferase n=1 Tax=Sediminicoccus sp. KRV36 TaxID=3133721 RepID=UPI00200FD338|nr:FkbM family methyltransferase [Sediminicoccus rosea]UPY35790.1 FkbM family methyltransferase [Sediminicoccus rosea]